MVHQKRGRWPAAWLAIMVAVVLIVLALQLRTAYWRDLVWVLDVRNWNRIGWMVANLLAVLMLIAIRFGPDLQQRWVRNRAARSAMAVDAVGAADGKLHQPDA